ncbi:MAG: penicillin-binding transpeptidase domain-containing protein [Planctomycetota bacterium]
MQRSRILPIALLFLMISVAVGWRLVQLQAVEWRRHALQASSIHRSVRYIPGPRGEILDSRGLLLAGDAPVIRATFLLSELEPVRWVARRIALNLKSPRSNFPWDEEALWSSLQQARAKLRGSFSGDLPLAEHAWLRNLSLSSGKKLKSVISRRPEDFPGIRIEINESSSTIFIRPSELFAGEIGIRRLEKELQRESGELWSLVENAYQQVQDPQGNLQDREWVFRRQRHLLIEKVPPSLVVKISTQPERWPGIHLEEAHRRIHPQDPYLGQLLGHAGLPTDREIKRWKNRNEPVIDRFALRDLRTFDALRPYSHHSADRVGRSGLEKMLEDKLRGMPGAEVRILDHRRRTVGSPLQVAPAARGQSISLAIDFEFSKKCSDLLSQAGVEHGAAVMIDVKTGKAFGWSSLPAQGMEVYRDRSLYTERIQSDQGWFFDRVSSWAVDPGSTYKTVVALIALQEGVITANEKILCNGVLDISQPNQNRCLNHPRGLELNLAEALSRSCNVYFYHVGQRLGLDRIIKGSQELGFWQKTGCGAVNESVGIKPKTNPAGTAIGRGFTTTPLQMAQVALSIACRGETPGIELTQGYRGLGLNPQISLNHYETIIDGMVSAVRDRGGTASKPEYELRNYDVAVKTGTAKINNSGNLNTAWIIGFAPVLDPQVAFAISAQGVLGHGGDTCAPLIAKMFDWLVKNRDMELLR